MLSGQQVVELHAQGRSVYSVSAEFNIPSSSLHRRFRALGLDASGNRKIREDKVKDHEPEIIRLLEQGKSRGEISRMLGCAASSVSRILKKDGLGGSIRTHPFDESFFDPIDAEEKAYALGMFVTDGCNMGKSASIYICDRDVVEKISNAVGYSGDIRVCQPGKGSNQVAYGLDLCSHHLCDSLAKQGCPRKKAFPTRFPDPEQVPGHLLRHYVRGLLDGDGSIYSTRGDWNACFSGTEDLPSPPLKLIRDETRIFVGGVYKHGNISILRAPGARNCVRVLDWPYEGSTIHMDRKYAKYLAMKAEMEAKAAA